jgi:hypothetical protein
VSGGESGRGGFAGVGLRDLRKGGIEIGDRCGLVWAGVCLEVTERNVRIV